MGQWVWQVPLREGGLQRADLQIAQELQGSGQIPGASRTQIQKWMGEGRVTCNGLRLLPRTLLAPGSVIEIGFPEPPPPPFQGPRAGALDLLYEDDDLIFVNKPPGLLVHPPAQGASDSLVHRLLAHYPGLPAEKTSGSSLWRPGIVHRLDQQTSGVLVVAKNIVTHQALTQQFAEHRLLRQYWALCYQAPSPQAPRRVEGGIMRHPKDRTKRMVASVPGEGKWAVTTYQVQKTYRVLSGQAPFASWLEVTLETGRTHQVRVHLTHLGCSLLGDPVYGTPSVSQPKWKALPQHIQKCVQNLPGQALHARCLGLLHPRTGQWLFFTAPPPPAWEALLQSLEHYS